MPQYRPNFTVAHFMSIPYVVKGSQIIGVVQRRLADIVQASLSLRTFRPPIAIDNINETLIWHSRNSADPAHEWMRALIQREAQLINAGADVVPISLKQRPSSGSIAQIVKLV